MSQAQEEILAWIRRHEAIRAVIFERENVRVELSRFGEVWLFVDGKLHREDVQTPARLPVLLAAFRVIRDLAGGAWACPEDPKMGRLLEALGYQPSRIDDGCWVKGGAYD